jgi:AAA+ superfamily predicted ATPase
MKIALIGAPGSGKTAFAKKLAKEYGIPVYDNEAQKFTKKTDIIVGLASDFRVELALLGERIQNAYKYWEEEGVFTQTILDSFAYQNIRREFGMRSYTENDIEFVSNLEREEGLTKIFAEVFLRTFKYDKIYHLKMFEDTTDTESHPELFLAKIIESAHLDIIEAFLNGEDVETIKRPPKIRRGSVAKD